VKTLYNFLLVFSFNLSIVKFSCFVGSDAPVLQYVSKMFMVPVMMVMLLFTASIIHLIRPIRKYAYLSAPCLVNTFGLTFTALFMPVSLLSLQPFQCVGHPNGFSTLAHDRSVVCWQWTESNEHMRLVSLGIVAILLYPVAFLAGTGLLTWNYRRWTNVYGILFFRYVRFLTVRMDPKFYYYGFLFNLRNFVLALSPIMFPNNLDVVVLIMLMCFLLWNTMSMQVKPWRFEMLTHFDTVTNMMHMVVLFCFLAINSHQGGHLKDDMAVERLGWLVIILFIASTLSMGVLGASKIIVKFAGTKEYGIFLSHHKSAAALVARRCKMILQDLVPGKHFLDVDELTNLDNLLFTVRSNVETVVVLLTPEVLSRFWCAIEITVAHLNKVPIILLAVDSNFEFEPKYLENVQQLWTAEQIQDFTTADVTVQDMESAYHSLSTLEQILFIVSNGDGGHRAALERVVKRCAKKGLKKTRYRSLGDPEQEHAALIAFDTESGPQHIVAHILSQLFEEVSWWCSLCNDMCAAHRVSEQTLAVGIVLVSKGITHNPVTLTCITAFAMMDSPVVCVQSQEAFVRPDASYFADMSSNRVLSQDQMDEVRSVLPLVTGEDLSLALKALYKILAWRISPEGSERTMTQEFVNIRVRAETEAKRKKFARQRTQSSGSRRIYNSLGPCTSEPTTCACREQTRSDSESCCGDSAEEASLAATMSC